MYVKIKPNSLEAILIENMIRPYAQSLFIFTQKIYFSPFRLFFLGKEIVYTYNRCEIRAGGKKCTTKWNALYAYISNKKSPLKLDASGNSTRYHSTVT